MRGQRLHASQRSAAASIARLTSASAARSAPSRRPRRSRVRDVEALAVAGLDPLAADQHRSSFAVATAISRAPSSEVSTLQATPRASPRRRSLPIRACETPGVRARAPRSRSAPRRRSPSSRADPHPLLDRLREPEPVSWLPVLDGWLVTRRDLALDVMRDAETFTVDDPRFSTAQVVGPSMLSLDGAEHARHRDAVRAPVPARRRRERFTAARRGEVRPRCSTRSRRTAGRPPPDAHRPALGRRDGCRARSRRPAGRRAARLVPRDRRGVTDISAGREPSGEAAPRSPRSRRRSSRCSAATPDSSLLAARQARRRRCSRERGRLERGRPAVRRDRDDRRDDRERCSTTCSRDDERAPRCEARPALARERGRGVAPARARGGRDRPLRDAGRRARRRARSAARELVRVSLAAANRDPAVFPDPHRFDLRRAEREAPRDVRPRPARLPRDAPRAARGPGRARAGARAAARAPARPRPATARRRASSSASRPSCACVWATARGGTVTRMAEAFIVDAVRTPIGRRNGSLAEVRADELAAQALNGLVARLDLDPGEIEDVQMGCVTQVGEQALNVARMSSLVAGWPETVCGSPIDRQCGSSMQAAFNAAAAIQAGHLDVVVAAGVESMSRVPMGSNLDAERLRGLLAEALRALGDRAAGHLGRGDRGRVGALARGSRRVLARVAPARDRRDRRGPLRARDRAGRGRRGGRRGARRGRREPAPRHVAREARLAPAGVQGGRQGLPPATRARSSTAPPRCSSRARPPRRGSGSSRGRGSSRSASPASTRTGCSTATRSPASARSRRPGSAGTTWP